MSKSIPNLLFVGAGSIAQSIIKGIVKAEPLAAQKIIAIAPSETNLKTIRTTLKCRTSLLDKAETDLASFEPDYTFLCVKPQVLRNSIVTRDSLSNLLKYISRNYSQSTVLSLLCGFPSTEICSAFNIPEQKLVRIMLNTASELRSTTIFRYGLIDPSREEDLDGLLSLLGTKVIKVDNESLMDVATGLCGSGISFFYEMIQAVSDLGVRNGLSRIDSTIAAAQLAEAAGRMVLEKNEHPYQLRDAVTSPAGSTIYGLDEWHERGVNNGIKAAIQKSIDRATELASKQ